MEQMLNRLLVEGATMSVFRLGGILIVLLLSMRFLRSR
jgi:hypothetical protein